MQLQLLRLLLMLLLGGSFHDASFAAAEPSTPGGGAHHPPSPPESSKISELVHRQVHPFKPPVRFNRPGKKYRVDPHPFPLRLSDAQLRRGIISGGADDPRLVGLARRLRRGEPLVAAALGSSITRDFAGDCGGAGCAWQLEGKVNMPREPDKLRKNGWMNHFLNRGVAALYPNTKAPGHGFVNGGQGGSHVEQVTVYAPRGKLRERTHSITHTKRCVLFHHVKRTPRG